MSLASSIRNHIGDLERRLMSGASIKVVLIDPLLGGSSTAIRRSLLLRSKCLTPGEHRCGR
jgi:hypothetical protein